MDTHAYPGKGLSLSQLVFALNEEIKRVACPPRFTLEEVSQLDRDVSIALASIREWKNSFVRINRIPMDILSLLPHHLSSQQDRFHAASVCRHWRKILLKCGALWSQVLLRKGEECVSTLLERAKGSPLDILFHRGAPAGTIALISPRAQQIRCLELILVDWRDVIKFSEFNSGQLPLLRTLKIISPQFLDYVQPNAATSPFFGGSINLQQFFFHSWKLPCLSHFVFPNLTTFELVSCPGEECSASLLLDFLKSSPMLQTVKAKISAEVVLKDIPQKMVVVLPNAQTFSLRVCNDPTTQVYDMAAHVSCPRARSTSLMHSMVNHRINGHLEIFPTSVSWNTILRQYVASPIEEIALEIKSPEYDDVEGSLTFRSTDATSIRLCFKVDETGVNRDELHMGHDQIGWEIFSQALTTIQDHPLLSHIKRLHLTCKVGAPSDYTMSRMSVKIRELFSSLGPLDELTIYGCDLRIFLATFLDSSRLEDSEPPIVFPQIKKLAVLHVNPSMEFEENTECMNAFVELAKSQHALGIPFERVAVRTWRYPPGMADQLRPWVTAVDCHQEWWREQLAELGA
ncbi:hypothetical protein BJ322DRAFT_1067017 [Thelephora terrestris]|uniref:F-box domain-containing protein n=1 Tax=Thelephora terrestris TaxID=56493 RepID=A0A9P6HBX8_9AGAM|nr:hypothetical protein BJ322DRAFT_1067017 [Thelephora terrestris]